MPANSQCVVLCLALGPIEHRTDESLRELERRGYKVWRSKGFSAIDQGRNVLAADALHQGYHETLWIDPDVAFEPDAVERLRSHKLPIVAGIYPQKGRRSLSCHVLPGTETITFGEDGGLIEIEYAAAGFLLVRRGAYETIRERLALPPCNARFGRPFWPFFQPLVKQAAVVRSATHSHPEATQLDELPQFLAHDFAFCERARQAGLKIMADTTLRLWHLGSYPYGWEDAGRGVERFETYHFEVE